MWLKIKIKQRSTNMKNEMKNIDERKEMHKRTCNNEKILIINLCRRANNKVKTTKGSCARVVK